MMCERCREHRKGWKKKENEEERKKEEKKRKKERKEKKEEGEGVEGRPRLGGASGDGRRLEVARGGG